MHSWSTTPNCPSSSQLCPSEITYVPAIYFFCKLSWNHHYRISTSLHSIDIHQSHQLQQKIGTFTRSALCPSWAQSIISPFASSRHFWIHLPTMGTSSPDLTMATLYPPHKPPLPLTPEAAMSSIFIHLEGGDRIHDNFTIVPCGNQRWVPLRKWLWLCQTWQGGWSIFSPVWHWQRHRHGSGLLLTCGAGYWVAPVLDCLKSISLFLGDRGWGQSVEFVMMSFLPGILIKVPQHQSALHWYGPYNVIFSGATLGTVIFTLGNLSRGFLKYVNRKDKGGEPGSFYSVSPHGIYFWIFNVIGFLSLKVNVSRPSMTHFCVVVLVPHCLAHFLFDFLFRQTNKGEGLSITKLPPE